ncbi:hypothetical protein BDK51DRAFT_52472 [Blyttiomyces helicus]|uniref:Uncharacterized protein n=1 Tax=Blyttiomyces helicus TaxID=388810 RepID=A0A4P9VY54_9FUNG|nr:hypothetical protein BDK51DRAFT_52472 [Blyttiomyces helicus]|eukprot:RKO84689.1 hypothetical protein BDK51DRAFT_52472 [Blyttiomyces helicus]
MRTQWSSLIAATLLAPHPSSCQSTTTPSFHLTLNGPNPDDLFGNLSESRHNSFLSQLPFLANYGRYIRHSLRGGAAHIDLNRAHEADDEGAFTGGASGFFSSPVISYFNVRCPSSPAPGKGSSTSGSNPSPVSPADFSVMLTFPATPHSSSLHAHASVASAAYILSNGYLSDSVSILEVATDNAFSDAYSILNNVTPALRVGLANFRIGADAAFASYQFQLAGIVDVGGLSTGCEGAALCSSIPTSASPPNSHRFYGNAPP